MDWFHFWSGLKICIASFMKKLQLERTFTEYVTQNQKRIITYFLFLSIVLKKQRHEMVVYTSKDVSTPKRLTMTV